MDYFTYEKKEFDEKDNCYKYTNCVLLKDMPFNDTEEGFMHVTFHDDRICVKGAKIDEIKIVGRHYYGWVKNDIVMDNII